MDRLPETIHVTIFKFLPLADLQNVRLTCRSWYRTCNCAAITKHEKFVFRMGRCGDDSSILENTILNCEKIRSSLEFHGLSCMTDISLSIWEHFGDRITSLFLFNCKLNENTIENIILHCTHLTSFRLQAPAPDDDDDSIYLHDEVFFPDNALDGIIASGIVRTNLVSFQLFIPTAIPDFVLEKIYLVYPNLRTLGIGSFWSQYNMNMEKAPETALPSVLPPMIESFIFSSFPSCWFWGDSAVVPQFTELEICLKYGYNVQLIEAFFSQQTALKKINLGLVDEYLPTERAKAKWASIRYGSHVGRIRSWSRHIGISRRMTAQLLSLILKKSPELRELRIRSNSELALTVAELKELLEDIRNLTSLELSFTQQCHILLDETKPSSDEDKGDEIDETGLAATEEKAVELSSCFLEYNFRKLRLEFSHTAGQTVDLRLEILKRCSSLQYLSVSHVNDEMLGVIFNDHTTLRTLRIFCKSDHSTSSCTLKGFAEIRRFQNLEHLEIVGLGDYMYSTTDEVKAILMDAFRPELEFPKLKYFKFSISKYKPIPGIRQRFREIRHLSSDILDILSHKAANLEVLKLDTLPLMKERYLTSYKRLKRLKFIISTIIRRSEGPHLLRVFSQCPELIYVTDEHSFHYYDRSSNTVHHKEMPTMKPIYYKHNIDDNC